MIQFSLVFVLWQWTVPYRCSYLWCCLEHFLKIIFGR